MFSRKIIYIISFVCICIFLLGCNLPDTKETTGSTNNINYSLINPNNVVWINMIGGLQINTKILFKENSYNKIFDLVSIINKGNNKKIASEEEIHVLSSRARPIKLQFKMKDGSYIYVYPSYETYKLKNGWGTSTRNDKFVLVIKDKYFSIDSKEVTQLFNTARLYMPTVNRFDVTPYEIKIGNPIQVNGDGCTESELYLYIEKTHRIKYLIAIIRPTFGKWEWKGKIDKVFTSVDGKNIRLEKGHYSLSAHIGYSTMGCYFEVK